MRSDCCETDFVATQTTINRCRAEQGRDMLMRHFDPENVRDPADITDQELVQLGLLHLMHYCAVGADIDFDSALKQATETFNQERAEAVSETP